MPTTYATVRKLALQLPDVEEGLCFGTPALYVDRKLMARLREDGETLVLKVAPAERARLFEADPDAFFTTDHYRNYPVMLVNLLAVRSAAMPGLIEGAWRFVASAKQLKNHGAKSA